MSDTERSLDREIAHLEASIARVRELRQWVEADPAGRDLLDPGELAKLTRRGLYLAPGAGQALV